ncbi:hypothetical protein V2A60_006790 [Cordyceps javanica]
MVHESVLTVEEGRKKLRLPFHDLAKAGVLSKADLHTKIMVLGLRHEEEDCLQVASRGFTRIESLH